MTTDPTTALEQTRLWFETEVLGLSLCPFAAAPYRAGRVRMVVCAATTETDLLHALAGELQRLVANEPAALETSLLIHPDVLQAFDDYNQFLDNADQLIEDLDLEGVIQVASFHPDYQFAGVDADDPGNATNQSPYPMLHLLREDSIQAVLDAGADSQAISERNVALLRVRHEQS